MKQKLLETIGRLIKIKRYNLEMTRIELHNLTKVSLTNLASIEQGECNTTIYTLYKIANALDCEVSDLLPRR